MLQFTSLLFATNAAHAFQTKHLMYAGLFVALTVTSILWHSSDKFDPASMTAFWMDQYVIWAVVLFSLFYAFRLRFQRYQWIVLALMVAAASLTATLGLRSWTRSYPVEHSALHGIVSLCGHCILAGL